MLQHLVTTHHLHDLQDMDFEHAIGLIKPKQASKKLRAFLVESFCLNDNEHLVVLEALTARHSELSTSAVADVVLLGTSMADLSAGQVWAFADIMGEHVVLVHTLELVSRNRRHHSATYRFTNEHKLFPL